jgi:hypothetical protein
MSAPTPTTADDKSTTDLPKQALKIREFCLLENFSKSTYYKLKNSGLGPEESILPLPGGMVIRISPAAYAAWKKKRATHKLSTQEKLARARRNKQRAAAAKLATNQREARRARKRKP